MISVLLPTYNSANTIALSIKSILNQTFTEFELLILDDGSMDHTEEVVSKFADPRIRYVQLPHQGLPITLNVGLELSKYDVIARMDAGDISLPERFGLQYQYLVSHAINYVITCQYAVFSANKIQYLILSRGEHSEIKRRLALHPDFAHSGVMYYKEFIIRSGKYRNISIEDYDLWLRIKDKAVFCILPEILLLTEYRNDSLSASNVLNRDKNHYSLQEAYYNDLHKEFGILKVEEETRYRGWREYFYGDKAQARYYWKKVGFGILVQPRVIVAWFVSYLPERRFLAFKKSRMKYRLKYLILFLSRRSRGVRKAFAAAVIERSV